MRFLRNNGLSVVLILLFLVTFAGQVLAGHAHDNEERARHGFAVQPFGEYLTSGEMWEATAENWESEFLQMFVFVVLTVVLFQKGSSQSKDPDREEAVDRPIDPHREGAPWPVRRGGLVSKLYEHSLSLVFLLLFVGAWAVHVVGGHEAVNEERRLHGDAEIQLVEYVTSATFWFESLQNWQSEFLAIAAMGLLSIVLRQRGSPESKPVDAATLETGAG